MVKLQDLPHSALLDLIHVKFVYFSYVQFRSLKIRLLISCDVILLSIASTFNSHLITVVVRRNRCAQALDASDVIRRAGARTVLTNGSTRSADAA